MRCDRRFLARVIGIAVLVMATLPAFGAEVSDSARAYRIGTVPWVGWSPLDVAEDQGFWSDLEVSVAPVHYADGVSLHDAMRIDAIDFGMDLLAHVADMNRTQRRAVILAETDWSDGGDKLIIRQDFALADHPGAPIGVYLEGSALSVFLAKYLASQGLHLADYRLAPMPPADLVGQFTADRIEAVVLFNPFAMEAQSEVSCFVAATTADFPGCMPEGMYTFRTTFTPAEEAAVEAILRGWIRAVRWIEDPAHANEYRRILRERTFAAMPAITDRELVEMLNDARIHTPRVLRAINRPGGEAARFLAGFNHTIGAAADSTTPDEVARIFRPQILMRALAAEGVAGE